MRQVFINCNARFIVPLIVVIHSLLKHNDPDKPIVVHIAYDESCSGGDYFDRIRAVVANFNFASVEFHDFTPVFKRYERELTIADDNPWPSLVWAFPLFTELMPDVTGNIVYLDADMQVRKDLGPLFDLDLRKDGYLAAAVDECLHSQRAFLEKVGWPKDAGDYFNNGTMVVDADAYRREGIAQKIPAIFAAHKREFYGVDQDLQNVLLGNRTLRLPLRWNYHDTWLKRSLHCDLAESRWECHRPIDVLQAVIDPCIVHYIGRFKPWCYTHRPERIPYRDEMRELGLLKNGRLPGETLWKTIEGFCYDVLHGYLKSRVRARYNKLTSARG